MSDIKPEEIREAVLRCSERCWQDIRNTACATLPGEDTDNLNNKLRWLMASRIVNQIFATNYDAAIKTVINMDADLEQK